MFGEHCVIGDTFLQTCITSHEKLHGFAKISLMSPPPSPCRPKKQISSICFISFSICSFCDFDIAESPSSALSIFSLLSYHVTNDDCNLKYCCNLTLCFTASVLADSELSLSNAVKTQSASSNVGFSFTGVLVASGSILKLTNIYI